MSFAKPEVLLNPCPPSDIGLFWRSLVEDGQVGVFGASPPGQDEFKGLDTFIQEQDRDNRLHLPGTPPSLDIPAARWACLLIFRACQFLVIRDVDAEMVEADLTLPCPGTLSPSVIYSADIALSHLGEILKLSAQVSENDPLTKCLRLVAAQWPLSSVGIEIDEEMDLDPILADRCLATLYADRIFEHQDLDRLHHPEVARLVATHLGAYPELNPRISQKLKKVMNHE